MWKHHEWVGSVAFFHGTFQMFSPLNKISYFYLLKKTLSHLLPSIKLLKKILLQHLISSISIKIIVFLISFGNSYKSLLKRNMYTNHVISNIIPPECVSWPIWLEITGLLILNECIISKRENWIKKERRHLFWITKQLLPHCELFHWH